VSRARFLIIAAGTVILVAVVGFTWVLWPRGTTEVTERDALADFRNRTEASTSVLQPNRTPSPNGSGEVPPPGVYTYRADGQEDVKLGPLPTETRPLPDTVTAVVVDQGDGCFEWTINLFAEHTEDTLYCADPSGALTLAGHTTHQRLGALSPTARSGCDPNVLIEPGSRSSTLNCDMSMDGAPVAITATLVGTATGGDTEQVTIGGEQVTVTPLTVSYEVTGDLSGTWNETLWLRDDFLPVRVERHLDLSGPATFSERSRLELVELSPST